jgi:hypothetical protein
MIQAQATTKAQINLIYVLALMLFCLTPSVLIMKTSRLRRDEYPVPIDLERPVVFEAVGFRRMSREF